MSDLTALYNQLPAPSQALLQLLATAIEPLDNNTIIDCLYQIGIKDANNSIGDRKSLPVTIDSLNRQGLVKIVNKNRTSCSPALMTFAVKHAMKSGAFVPMAEELLRITPLKNSWAPFGSYPRFLRHLRYCMFKGNSWPAINQILERGDYEFREKCQQEHPFFTLFTLPFEGEYISLFPQPIQVSVVGYLIHSATIHFHPAQEIFDFLRSAPWQGEFSVNADNLLAYYLTHWGLWQEGRKHFDAIPESDQDIRLGLLGWHQTLTGHDQEAITLFSKDLKAFQKLTGKRKTFFDDASGIFFILSLIRSGNSDNLALAEKQIGIIESLKHHPLHHYSLALREIISIVRGSTFTSPPKTMIQSAINTIEGLSPLSTLIKALTNFWQDQNYCRTRWQDMLISLRDRAKQAGHIWMTMETAELLARLDVDPDTNHQLAESLRKQYGLVSIIDTIRQVDPWERRLQALINLPTGGKGQKSDLTTNTTERLIWLFSHDTKHGYCDISPRLQRLNKNGKWSGGRAVAIKKLAETASTMEGLTSQDRNICATIKSGYERDYYTYYTREYHRFNMETALTALVGHPLIFLDHSDVQIDLVQGEPELVVTRGKKGIEVRMVPFPDKDSANYQMIKETPTRFKLVRFSAHHLTIATILQKGLKVPTQAEQLTNQAIAALSSMITVHSDLEGGTAGSREVEADPRPHIHLLPFQDGLKAEFLIKPLAEADMWYKPGVGGQKVFAEVAGEKLYAARDLTQEKALATQLIAACPSLSRQEEENGEYLIPAPEDSLDLLLELRDAGEMAVVEWPQGESLKIRGRASASSLSLSIKQDRDWFKASGSLTFDDAGVVSLQQLLGLLDQTKGRFVKLDDGSFLALTKEFKARLEALRDYSEKHGDGVRFSPLAALAMEDLDQDLGEIKTDRHWKKHLERFNKSITPAVPSTLQAELRDYQVTGFTWLSQLAHWGVGACLADDMGLGKTIQALAAILRLATEGPTLVIAPLSVLMNWQDEAQRFAPTLNVIPFGQGDRQQALDSLQPFDLMVCSYGLLQSEAEKLSQVQWQTIVLDEAQAIKNMNTKRSKAAMSLQGRFKFITTGTPVENHLGELWTLFEFINPGLLGSLKHFSRTFMGSSSPENDKKTRGRLKKLVQPFILRRLKSQVLQELPSRTEITLRVEMSPEEAALYEAQRRLAVEKLTSGHTEPQGQQHIRILAEIMRLRRLCCNPALVLPQSTIESSKLRVFGDLLNDIRDNRHKALVFSQFVDHLAILSAFLDQRGISYQYLDGSTPVATRRKRINAFQSGEGDVFLISLKAGGSGLNLTAADYVIHMDPWWNPAVEDQASDRAHRIGQLRPVTIYRLVMGDSIEEEIIKLHRQKRDIADSLLAGGDISGTLGADELLALLKKSASITQAP
ncbi:MAG: DEAD/DEAH box helicase [Proteobacteria bacterium]|nr:DEAD/DEAH box helicase [Desulfobulbaceae bacterium]MBU4152632.1 DEAD/DEAH box helicase [Pseudomonadota bacterium]